METKQELVAEVRRETILRATRHVLAQRGVTGASMQAIAEEAHVAKGTLYLYFRDRTQLLEQAASGVFDELLGRLRAEIRPGRPLAEGLRALVHTNLEFFEANREFLRVYLEMRAPEGAACHRRRQRPQYARYLELLEGFLRDAMQRREMKPFDPARLALFVAEGVSAVITRRLEERGRTTEDVEWIVDLLLDGICTRKRS